MKTTSLFVVLLFCTSVFGTEYKVQWGLPGDYIHLTGTVDTTRDSLTVETWEINQAYYLPWSPTYIVGTEWFAYDEHGRYDVPDDWDGTIHGVWGFLAPAAELYRDPPFVGNPEIVPGFGCGSGSSYPGCTQFWKGDPSTVADLWNWWYRRQPLDGSYARMEVQSTSYLDITPASPNRIRGDVDLDGQFRSGDLVAVFQRGLYETGKAAGWPEGDWTGDGLFDSSDMVAAFQGGKYETFVPWPAVPEPGGFTLAFLALLAWRMLQCRRSEA